MQFTELARSIKLNHQYKYRLTGEDLKQWLQSKGWLNGDRPCQGYEHYFCLEEVPSRYRIWNRLLISDEGVKAITNQFVFENIANAV